MNYLIMIMQLILPYPIISNLNKNENHDNETIQASPKWGKKGVGAVIPLVFFINFYNFDVFYILPLPWKNMERKG